MNVPTFLRKNGDQPELDTSRLEAEIARLPHPRSDPLNPAVADLMSKAIMESGEAYVQAILTELERNCTAAQELLEQGRAWAESERARFTARAQDIAEAHLEMQDSREKFLALPRAPESSPMPKIHAQPF